MFQTDLGNYETSEKFNALVVIMKVLILEVVVMRFTIKGDKDSGRYVALKDGKELFEISNMHYGGLKEARQRIGSYLQAKGHSLNESFEHECIKPGRKNNPKLKWSVEEYLIGVPIKK